LSSEDPKLWITFLIDQIQQLGWLSPFVLAIAHILCVAGCFPGSVMFEWAAGLVFGVSLGFILILISKSIGGGLGFLLGRNFFRKWVQEKLVDSPKLQKIFSLIGKDGWKIALFLRISPLPSWLNTYGLALTPISFKDFMIATILGSIPMIMQNVYVGSIVQNLSDPKPHGWLNIIAIGFMILSTIAFSRYLYNNYFEKILNEKKELSNNSNCQIETSPDQ